MSDEDIEAVEQFVDRAEYNLDSLTALLKEAESLFAATFNGAPASVPMGDCALHFTRRDSKWGFAVSGPDGQVYDGWSIDVRCAMADQLEALWAACVAAEAGRDLRVCQAIGVATEFLDRRRKVEGT